MDSGSLRVVPPHKRQVVVREGNATMQVLWARKADGGQCGRYGPMVVGHHSPLSPWATSSSNDGPHQSKQWHCGTCERRIAYPKAVDSFHTAISICEMQKLKEKMEDH